MTCEAIITKKKTSYVVHVTGEVMVKSPILAFSPSLKLKTKKKGKEIFRAAALKLPSVLKM